MKKRFIQFFIALLFCFKTVTVLGQYTEVINSNRPGFSESPYSLGTGVYQLESSLFYKNTEANRLFTRPEAIGIDFLFRTGLFSERLEINSNFKVQRDKVAFTNIFQSSYNETGISQFTVNAKYLIFKPTYKDPSKEVRSWKKKFDYDYKRLIPAVAIYAGANTNFVSEFYQLETITPKVGVLLQQNFTPDFNLINNFYYDNIGSIYSKYTYIITGTQNFGNRLSSFFEYKGDYFSFRNDHNVGVGLAFLFSKDLQINASGRFLLEGTTTGFFTSLGASYRLDKHKDSFKDLENIDYVKEDSPVEKYNKKKQGFFSRLFGSSKSKRKKSTRKR
ncbi:transporter, partial [Polaribacter sp.]|nr:transporter [Polaribacter sp.]